MIFSFSFLKQFFGVFFLSLLPFECSLNFKVKWVYGRGILEIEKQNFYQSEILEYYNYRRIMVMKKLLLKLDPVGSTVRYEMTKLCTGSV